MIYGSVCSGIEAASVAWRPLGWRAAFVSEIEAFPRAVLQHRWPEIPLHGDFTTISASEYEPIDLLVGGTPCQSFSVAGLRGGLADDRGNLALEYLRLADRLRPRWLVWENVPGVLSSAGGRDFGAILGGMVELGYGFAYRVLDAQHLGVPQRRRRVFVVGYLGDWRRAAAVLFERHSLQGHSPPRREAGERVAGTFSAGAHPGGYNGQDAYNDLLIPHTVGALQTHHTPKGHGCAGVNSQAVAAGHIVPALYSIMPQNIGKDYKARHVPVAQPLMAGGNPASAQGGDVLVQPIAFNLRGREGGAMPEVDDLASMRAASGGSSRSYLAFDTTQITSAANYSNPQPGDPCHPLASGAHPPAIAGSAVRRLTPRECERLQGFPDDYTLIPWRKGMASDGPRYKALGNSMAVPVMAWIGQRMAQVEALATTPQGRAA